MQIPVYLAKPELPLGVSKGLDMNILAIGFKYSCKCNPKKPVGIVFNFSNVQLLEMRAFSDYYFHIHSGYLSRFG